MKFISRDIKVIPGDDGRCWVCLPCSSDEMHELVMLFAELTGKCRALQGKVKTAEVTRFRRMLGASHNG